MRRHVLAALAVATLLTPVAANAAPPDPLLDRPCALSSALDPTPEAPDGTYTGTLAGGPVFQNGTLACVVVVGAQVVASAAVNGTNGMTTVAPTTVSYIGEPALVCSRFTDQTGVTYHYSAAGPAWSTDPTAGCDVEPATAPATDALEPVVTPLRDVTTWGPSFPPAGFAVTGVAWSYAPGQGLVFTPPIPAASRPANWSCATSFPSSTSARAECVPLPGQEDPGTTGWACYDPFVNVHVVSPVGTGANGVDGRSACGTSEATCTATTSELTPAGLCSDWALPPHDVPLVCEADFANAAVTSSWSVRCAPVDP
ncbi:MAG TPA: hypothetical protein VNQ77_16375 [Frankiaceae bacterium]|nr:hypothetical protein [Frankiaceae bacterium]